MLITSEVLVRLGMAPENANELLGRYGEDSVLLDDLVDGLARRNKFRDLADLYLAVGHALSNEGALRCAIGAVEDAREMIPAWRFLSKAVLGDAVQLAHRVLDGEALLPNDLVAFSVRYLDSSNPLHSEAVLAARYSAKCMLSAGYSYLDFQVMNDKTGVYGIRYWASQAVRHTADVNPPKSRDYWVSAFDTLTDHYRLDLTDVEVAR